MTASMPGFQDAGLFASDGHQVMTEPVHMVEIDRHDHADRTLHDVRGIPRASQPHLNRGHRHWRVRESDNAKNRQYFKERQRATTVGLDHAQNRRDVVPRRQQLLFADGLAVDDDSLPNGLQVGTGETPGTQPKCRQQRIDHSGRRRLAIGTQRRESPEMTACGDPRASRTAATRSSVGSMSDSGARRISSISRLMSRSARWSGPGDSGERGHGLRV